MKRYKIVFLNIYNQVETIYSKGAFNLVQSFTLPFVKKVLQVTSVKTAILYFLLLIVTSCSTSRHCNGAAMTKHQRTKVYNR